MEEFTVTFIDLTEEFKLNLISSEGITDHKDLTSIGVKTHATLDSEVSANTLKVGITPTQASDITTNNAKVTYPGDQDLSGLALKTNVLEKDNTTAFTPTADYHPSTKKYVDDNGGGGKFVDGTDPLDAVYLDGNVGIGINNPTVDLDIRSQIGDVAMNLVSTNGNDAKFIFGEIDENNGGLMINDGGNNTFSLGSVSAGVQTPLLHFTKGGIGVGFGASTVATAVIHIKRRNSGVDMLRAEGKDGGSYILTETCEVGIKTLDPKSALDVNGGIKIADDTDTITVDKVGTIRYRTDANNSYMDMAMQTGVATYQWVNIKTNTW